MKKQARFFRWELFALAAVAAFGFGNGKALAQGSTAAPFNKVTVSEDVAKRTLTKAVINADTARQIVDACVEWQKAQPGNVTIAIFVLSPTGQIIDSHQMDGVLPDRRGNWFDEGQDCSLRPLILGRRGRIASRTLTAG